MADVLPRGAGTLCSKCCEREAWSRGLCDRCYQYERKAGRLPKILGAEKPRVLLGPEDVKRCRTCGEEKVGAEFWTDNSARDGKQSLCHECNTKQSAEWKKANPEGTRAIRHRRRARSQAEWREWKYGITPEQFDAAVKAQSGVCAICRRVPKSARGLVVDHDHSTGAIRGLLCSGCNSGLGFLGDTAEGLERALAYLKEPAWQGPTSAR